MTFANVQFKYAARIVLGMCVVAFGPLLYSMRKLDFYFDEWDFVDKASHWNLGDYFVPHNEHWSTVPMVIYRVLLGVFGMHSYLPYSATLLLLHCGNAFLLFLLVRRRAGDALGIAAAAVLLVLGRGSDDFIWAFQIGFSCSVLFGLAAMLLLDADADAEAGQLPRRRLVGGSAMLVLSLMSSGEGLFFVTAAAVMMALRTEGPGWRPARFRTPITALAAPVLAYAVWYVLCGDKHATQARSPLSLHAVRGLLTFVPTGLGSGTAGLVGADWTDRWLGFAVFVAVFALVCRHGRAAALPIALGVGVIAQFCMTGLVRAQFGDQLAGTSRYVYIAAVFTLPMVTELLRGLSWRPTWQAATAAVTALSCVAGVQALHTAIGDRDRLFARQKAMLQAVWYHRDDPDLDPAAIIDPADAPTLTVRQYLNTRVEFGSPLPNLDAKGFAALDANAVTGAQVNVLRRAHR